MKLTYLAPAAIAFAALGATSAMAAPLTLPDGPIYFQFNNLEQVDTSLGNNIAAPGGGIDVNGDGAQDTPDNEGNWGVFNVSTMQYGGVATQHEDISGGTPFFADTLSHGAQVSGIFYGITTTGAQTATGGWMDIVWDESPDVSQTDLDGNGFTPGARTAANVAGKFTDGTLLARLMFTTGILDDGSNTTIKSNIDITTITGTGQADSFADVIDINNDGVIDAADGAWAASLNGNWFYTDYNNDGTIEQHDLRFSNFFNLLASWDGAGGITGLRSNDPGRAFIVSAVPEPGTIVLMGVGLVGFAIARRKLA